MEKDFKSCYWELLDELVKHEHGPDREFEFYQKLVELSDEAIKSIEDDAKTDVVDPRTGNILSVQPIFLDDIAAPMDNLARMYMERKEFDKALPLLEKSLPIYRTLEICSPKHTFQRYYATKALVECLHELGKETTAILYEFELKHLRRDVLKNEIADK